MGRVRDLFIYETNNEFFLYIYIKIKFFGNFYSWIFFSSFFNNYYLIKFFSLFFFKKKKKKKNIKKYLENF